MARTDPQFNLRISQELKDKISEAAKLSGRSVTAEMIARLEQTFNDEPDLAERVARLEDMVSQLLGFPRRGLQKAERMNPFTGEKEADEH